MRSINILCIVLITFILIETVHAFEIYATANPSSGSGILLVNFSGTATGDDGPYSYSWDFDNSDGIDVDKFLQNPTFVYAYPGIYTATLTVTNKYGTAKTCSINITVNPGAYKDTTEIVLKGIHALDNDPVIVEGYEIGGYTHGQHGILIDNCKNIIVRDCYIHHPELYVEFPIRIQNSQNIEIRNSHLNANTYSLYVDSCSNCKIVGVLIDSTQMSQSICILNSDSIEVAHCVLKNNGQPESWSNGIWFQMGCHNSSIHDNFVYNQSGGGIQITGIGGDPHQHTPETHCSNIDVYNNTVWHVHEEGTWLIGVSDINIYNNYYRVFCGHGVNLEWNAHNIKIFNNIFCGDAGYTNSNCWFLHSSRAWEGSGGIRLGSSYDNDVINNTFYMAGATPIIYADTTLYPPEDIYECFQPYPSTGNVIKNNIIINQVGSYFEVDSWAEGLSYNNIIVTTPVYDQPGLLSVDPMFRDEDNGNFMLKCNSPCIDAGDPVSDFSLEPGDNGGRINMGAFGNTSSATPSCNGNTVDSNIGNLSEISVYPNPTYGKYVFFSPLIEGATIQFFNVLGQLVKNAETENTDNYYLWHLDNNNNHPVPSGVYMYCIKTKEKIYKGSIVVIR